MNVSFHGASGEVTGSCYLVEAEGTRVLVDLGMFQGGSDDDERNRRLPPIDFESVHAVILTHAHLDHAGRLPLLARAGFRGPILATPATRDLADVLLRDSARLQEADAARSARRGNGGFREPLYTEADVTPILARIQAVPYNTPYRVSKEITLRFVDSGHILGAASVEVTHARPDARERPRTVVFSGDIGPRGVPLMNDPVPPVLQDGRAADLVVLESTYGDRDHRKLDETLAEAEEIVKEALWAKQKVIVPSFAIGRAQLVIYYLARLAATDRVPPFPIYLDSPMAIRAMTLYRRHLATLDEHAKAQIDGRFALDPPGLRCVESAEESKALNGLEGASVIVAGSGMCEGGRIVHHLRNGLWRKDVHIVIVGYQASGTLGRRLVDGATEVRILGETVPVRAKVHTLGGLSAHAGRSELLEWAAAVHAGDGAERQRIVLTHGEPVPRESLRAAIQARLGVNPILPAPGDRIEV